MSRANDNTTTDVTWGMMNHPAKKTISEIQEAHKLGFDFVDLTLEPPEAGPEEFDHDAVKAALEGAKMPIVGHTGWHLNGNAAYPEVRLGVSESLNWAAEQFSQFGASVMTYHIHGSVAKYLGLGRAIKSQIETLKRSVDFAGERGITIVCEHISAYPEQFEILDGLFASIDELGFHLDVGHANLSPSGTNETPEFLRRYGSRLRHVHFSDNRGRNDDHMPLGVGTISWPDIVSELKRRRYNATITLEVFTEDPDYLTTSLEKIKRLWNSS